MLKKLLLSLAALVVLSLSVSAETKELWHSDTDEGVLVDWGQAAFSLTAEQAAEINNGDTFTITVSGVTEGGWPQVCIFDDLNGGYGSILKNAGVGGHEYPYEVSFQMTNEFVEKVRKNGMAFGGNGAYVSAVSVTPPPFEVSPYAVWFGPKTCGYGTGVSIGKEVFADVAPGDKIQVFYEKDADHTLQFLFGGWSGANIPTYEFWKVSSFSDDADSGSFILELTSDLSNLKWEVTENDQKVEKEYDLFTLLKEGGLIMHGPCTVNQVLYIPKPSDPLALNASWWHQWDGFGADAKPLENPTKSFTSNVGKEGDFDFIIGNSNCDGDCYADLSEYGGIEGKGSSSNGQIRLFFNRTAVQGGNAVDKYIQFENDGTFTFNFSDDEGLSEFVHLNFVKFGWEQSGNVEYLRLIPKPDHIVVAKNKLDAEIASAKLYDSFAKTADSFTALTSAISAAETALNAENATEESLAAAGKAIEAAIAGLELAEGYSNLTAEMFKKYISYAEPGEGEGTNGAFKLFETTDNPYGTGGSDNNRWADVAGYDKVIVTFLGDAKPRVWINRSVENGQEGNSMEDSKMLDLQEGNGKWSTKKYTTFTQDGNLNIFTVDITSIKTDYNGVARLHGIKYGWGASGIVTGMYLFKDPNPLGIPKEHLQQAIDNAKNQDPFLKSEESWEKLQDAISAGEAELKNTDATQKSLEEATNAIKDAIAGLGLQDGYYYLTKEMFKRYDSLENPGEGEATGCDYNINTETGSPYGDGNNVGHLNWADLTDYDELILTLSGDTKPRVMMNRMGNNVPDNDDPAKSLMLEMHPDYTRWSTVDYTTYDAYKNIFTIKLKDIVDVFGFARLHAIKYINGQQGVVTGMYLYKDATEEFKLSFNIDDPSHVVVKVNDAALNLKAGNNEVNVANRGKLSIVPADKFKLASLTANDVEVALKDDVYSKVIVKPISFKIVTEDANPLAPQIKELNEQIEKAKLYDDYLKTKATWDALKAAIAAAEAEVAKTDATKESLEAVAGNLANAIKDLALIDDYSYLTQDMYKKYASLEEPGVGEKTDCSFVLFEASENPFGNPDNSELEWADLSDYDSLIITTYGNDTKPLITLNRLEANGQQAETKEASKMIDINPYANNYTWSTEKYQKIEDKSTDDNKAYTYIVNLKQIVKDFGFARLHSIKKSGWNVLSPYVSGMYLYKAPYVAVTEVTLDKSEATLTDGQSLTLKATVNPDNSTAKDVEWASSDKTIATVDAKGNVKAIGIGKVTITASCDGKSAKCTIKCYPQLGDATWDGAIDITDAVDISNYVVGRKTADTKWDEKEWSEFYKKGANVNGDAEGRITFADASAAVTLALGTQTSSEPAQSRIRAAYDESSDALVVGDSDDSFSIPVALDNSREYVALQADIILPEGMSVDVKAGARVADTHSLTTRRIDANHIRVALFSITNNAFADSAAPILEIITDAGIADAADIVITGIIASDADAHGYSLTSRTGDISGVAVIGFDPEMPVKVYDMNGIYVGGSTEGLQKGIYIVRQGNEAKKVRIR